MDPPPPQGEGKRYAVCAVCALPLNQRPARRVGTVNGFYNPLTLTTTRLDMTEYAATPLFVIEGTPEVLVKFRVKMLRQFKKEFVALRAEHTRNLPLRFLSAAIR